MVQISWTKLAISDLQEIHDYIARDSKTFAKLQIVRIRSQTRILKSQPAIGRIVPEIDQADIRELIQGSYRIIYKIISKERIDIITIHHSSRNLQGRKIEK